MRLKHTYPLLLAAMLAGCESFLEVDPISELPEESAITGPISARAAVAGLYDGLSDDGGYYGGDFYIFSDLSSDDVQHTGTFGSYRVADLNNLAPNNASVADIWDEIYTTVGRANTLIAKLPDVPGLEDVERNQMLGEAYFVRALSFHNALKLWGERDENGMGVPIPTAPPGSLGEASQIVRATTGDTYDQIIADLDQAAAHMTEETANTTGSLGAVEAIRARVLLYRGDWVGAEEAADSAGDFGYELTANYEDLFVTEQTEEDIFRISFTPVEYHNIGYYYRAPGFDGRWEVGPTVDLIQQWSPGYNPLASNPATTYDPGLDIRGQYVMRFRSRGRAWSNKLPSGVGDEDLHVIRYAEVLLIKAEAHAMQDELVDAIDALNPIRVRAGLAALDATGMTQAQVLAAIYRERRLELAFEADRWPDLVRRGLAAATLGIEAHRALYPVPLGEIDVAPGIEQNPNY